MSILMNVLSKARRTFFQYGFESAAREVLETKPLEKGGLNFVLLSMVHKRDVLAYLVAVKSFARYANPYRIVLVSDPTLTAEDKCKLKQHIPHIELRCAREFVHKGIPTGGCWERLHAISEYNLEDYVVQLDADTVTLQAPAEVLSALRENSGFVLGEEANQRVMTLNETADRSRMLYRDVQSIQCVVESSIDSVELDGKYYVRGCAGFTGFPKSSDMRDKMLAFSKEMTFRHGQNWQKWGTEQVASNYLVANMPGTKILPFPKYATPDASNVSTSFVHFIGYLRFANGKYRKAAKDVIQSIKKRGAKVSNGSFEKIL